MPCFEPHCSLGRPTMSARPRLRHLLQKELSQLKHQLSSKDEIMHERVQEVRRSSNAMTNVVRQRLGSVIEENQELTVHAADLEGVRRGHRARAVRLRGLGGL